MSDRRTFLHGLASLPLAGTSLALLCGTAAATPVDPDSDLRALGREWQVANDHMDHASAALDAAAGRLRDIYPPEPMFLHASDPLAMTCLSYRHGETTRLWYPSDEIERLRTYAFVDARGAPLVRDRARRDEIVSAYDAWRAEIAADEQAAGYTGALTTYEAAVQANHQLRQRIMSTAATTLAGVMVKARVIENGYGSAADMRAELEHSMGEGASDADTMAVSVIVDLLVMQAVV